MGGGLSPPPHPVRTKANNATTPRRGRTPNGTHRRDGLRMKILLIWRYVALVRTVATAAVIAANVDLDIESSLSW